MRPWTLKPTFPHPTTKGPQLPGPRSGRVRRIAGAPSTGAVTSRRGSNVKGEYGCSLRPWARASPTSWPQSQTSPFPVPTHTNEGDWHRRWLGGGLVRPLSLFVCVSVGWQRVRSASLRAGLPQRDPPPPRPALAPHNLGADSRAGDKCRRRGEGIAQNKEACSNKSCQDCIDLIICRNTHSGLL